MQKSNVQRPIFVLLLELASGASLLFLPMTRMENAARDAARQVSMGELNTEAVGTYVVSTLDPGPYSLNAEYSTGDYAFVRITRPVPRIVSFTALEPLLGTSICAETKMRLEPGVTLRARSTPRPCPSRRKPRQRYPRA